MGNGQASFVYSRGRAAVEIFAQDLERRGRVLKKTTFFGPFKNVGCQGISGGIVGEKGDSGTPPFYMQVGLSSADGNSIMLTAFRILFPKGIRRRNATPWCQTFDPEDVSDRTTPGTGRSSSDVAAACPASRPPGCHSVSNRTFETVSGYEHTK